MDYDFSRIEKKWQDRWFSENTGAAVTGSEKPKFYGLIEFPYPSGQGLHVGHARPFTAMDIICRKKRMEGYNVLFPIGFDAFGLPTENYAIKNHIHPAVVTRENIANFTKQLKMLGYSFDWQRVVDTTDPDYYKWTQWIFRQLFKNDLAYKATMPVNWCTSCKCVLANEEVVDGVCERCGSEVIRREKSQWMLRITRYADRLIDDLDDVDFIERVKIQQRNWIGRSDGTELTFDTTAGDKLTVFTTRCDTLFGVTYMVLSPEHPYLEKWKDVIENYDAVAAYREEAARKSDFERSELNKDKTGVVLQGVRAINPATKEEIPVFVSDYVLMSYGTGAVMGVPARLGVRHQVRPAHHRGGPRRRHHQRGLHAQGRYRHHGQLRLPQRHDREGSHPGHEKMGHRAGLRHHEDQLQAPRLGVQPPALLGRADPPGRVPLLRLGAGTRGAAARAAARGGEL